MTPRILALDLSLTASGVCTPDGTPDTLKPPKGMVGADRLDWWLRTFEVVLADNEPTRIVIEQPWSGGHGNVTLKLGELYGMWHLAHRRVCPAVATTWVPPKLLKKRWTGNGNASKAQMVAAIPDHVTVPCGTIDHNAADALALWVGAQMGWWDE